MLRLPISITDKASPVANLETKEKASACIDFCFPQYVLQNRLLLVLFVISRWQSRRRDRPVNRPQVDRCSCSVDAFEFVLSVPLQRRCR